ncbi:MAG: FMN-binding protein [Oscillospiraceae bacterium]|nr:FMN-binding protein [Oscillospiraceae bacterium]
MKENVRKAISYLITAAMAFCAAVLLVALLLRPQSLVIGTADLSTVADGEYIGVCQNKILFAVVKVEIKGHEIADIEVIAHKPSYMKQAEQTAEAVCAAQSLGVDAISGATLTSDTVRKAIENALKDGSARP